MTKEQKAQAGANNLECLAAAVAPYCSHTLRKLNEGFLYHIPVRGEKMILNLLINTHDHALFVVADHTLGRGEQIGNEGSKF